jgi:hypothetical protein
MTVSKN